MTNRERVLLTLQHKEADRIPVYDSIWGTTMERWRCEGYPSGKSPEDLFGWELRGFGGDETLQLPWKRLQETADYSMTMGPDGATVKNWKGRITTPEMIDFTVRTRADWEGLKSRMT